MKADPSRQQRKRTISLEFQRRFRQEQVAQGRKAVTVFVDPEIHIRLKEVQTKRGFKSVREATYHVLKMGLISRNTSEDM